MPDRTPAQRIPLTPPQGTTRPGNPTAGAHLRAAPAEPPAPRGEERLLPPVAAWNPRSRLSRSPPHEPRRPGDCSPFHSSMFRYHAIGSRKCGSHHSASGHQPNPELPRPRVYASTCRDVIHAHRPIPQPSPWCRPPFRIPTLRRREPQRAGLGFFRINTWQHLLINCNIHPYARCARRGQYPRHCDPQCRRRECSRRP